MAFLNIAVLASGGGSNLQSILDACRDGLLKDKARVVLVISNNSGAGALIRAKDAGIESACLNHREYPDTADLDQACIFAIEQAGANLVVFAGYMKKRGALFVRRFNNRILNIHPSLLPKHGGPGMYGAYVHRAVIAAGDTESGPTVHLVDEIYDHGRILAQKKVPVLAADTPETLAARVLVAEHALYPDVLSRIAAGEINLDE